jgi:hypothetical protein
VEKPGAHLASTATASTGRSRDTRTWLNLMWIKDASTGSCDARPMERHVDYVARKSDPADVLIGVGAFRHRPAAAGLCSERGRHRRLGARGEIGQAPCGAPAYAHWVKALDLMVDD